MSQQQKCTTTTTTTTTMTTTEVKKSSIISGNLGLFATESFQPGDIILEESPLFILAPSSSSSLTLCPPSIKNIDDDDIQPPPNSIPTEYHNTFRSMVKVGFYYLSNNNNNNNNTKILLDLYYPKEESNDDVKKSKSSSSSSVKINQYEKNLLNIAKEARKYIIKNYDHSKTATTKSDTTTDTTTTEIEDVVVLEKIMLIWACNSFEGGRIYNHISRVNHNCNPNSIIKVVVESSSSNNNKDNNNKQQLIAATNISVGDEITISYLGSFLYTDTYTRNTKLQQTKFFTCNCNRCCLNNNNDMANRIPCPYCHPRILPQYILEEDVQYDDDQTVQYVIIPYNNNNNNCNNNNIVTTKCCNKTINLEDDDESNNNKKLLKAMSTVTSKIISYLETQEGKKTTTESSSSSNNAAKRKNNDNEDDNDDDTEILEEYVSLASTIMGDKHWTTNIMLLLHLDRRLTNMSSKMITTQEIPEMDDIAEAIDSLQRLERYVNSLNLQLHMGHLLGDVIIGIGRALVALGDVKSQKYGSDWLSKISTDYVTKFESDGKQKVVTALSVAWEKHNNNNHDEHDEERDTTTTNNNNNGEEEDDDEDTNERKQPAKKKQKKKKS